MATETREPAALQKADLSGFSLLELRNRSGRGMTSTATLDSALSALGSNRKRSFLTMLGVIIGVSTVIAVVALTQGVNQSVSQEFAGLGTNIITISPGTTSAGAARSAAGSSTTLTVGDAQALEQIPTIVNVSPVISVSEQVVYGDQNWNTRVSGVYTSYQLIQNWQIAEGAWFSDQDEQMGLPVAVLGQTVSQNLFPSGGYPIGQTIRIGSALFRVVGVLQTKGAQGASNADDAIFVPLTAAKNRLDESPYVSQIQVQVDAINDITSTQQSISTVLRTRHNLPGPDPALQQNNSTQRSPLLGGGGGAGGYRGGGAGGAGGAGGYRGGGGGGAGGAGGTGSTGGASGSGQTGAAANSARARALAADPPDDFQITNVEQLIQSAQQNSAILTVLLIGIATISLAVGGIGIMNIMLVSVTERTREIGIRMAIGARRRDIRSQFLSEALILCVAGGLIGIVLGLLGGVALTSSLRIPYVLSPIPIVVAFTVSAAVGIAFGLYPAIRASQLDPITALRTTE